MINNEIQITQIIDEIQKDEILSIMYDAFEKKLSNLELKPKSREQGLRILRKSANYDQGLYAIHKSGIIGAVGMNSRKKRFYYFEWKVLLEEFGFIGASWRSIIQKYSADSLKDTELYIGSIAVAENYRGKGIGTKLLDAVKDLARNNGFESIILDVVDTNPRAFDLYKRYGYEVIKKRKFGFITRSAGFSFSYKMRYTI
ncbi:MAG: GNAT family N-acetyltransferase [Candidatus Aegiribacteria sp.]|nr:GNAT family N-acetyltransferase [Candidatus Aegiribacteria sp.]